MKESEKLKLIKFLNKYVGYCNGFWSLDGKLVTEETVKDFIRTNYTSILEKDILDVLSDITYRQKHINVSEQIVKNICLKNGDGESTYFKSLDILYPGNKFRQIMNYYLFSQEQYAFIFVGLGCTGKTTFVDVISKIIGEDFFGRSNVELLKNGHGTAVLEGKLLYEVAEAQDLDLDTANKLKSIITCNDIYINPKFQLPRKIKPLSKLIMTCNSVPRFRVTDDGIIRRFVLIEMNKKIKKQNSNFLSEIQEDIPNIIREAWENPFKIEDFAEEQYAFFVHDYQYGYGFGEEPSSKSRFKINGIDDYDRYRAMCSTFGYSPRNRSNFDKFISLAKIYKEKICDTISKDVTHTIGCQLLTPLEAEDCPF